MAQAYQRSSSAADVPVVLDCGSAVWKCGFVPLVRYAPQRSPSTIAQQLRSPRTSLTDAQRLELLGGAAARSPRTSVTGQLPTASRGLWENAEPFELPAFVGRERFASAVMPAASGRRPTAAATAATVYVGHKALARKGVLHLRQPLDPSSGTLVERADAGREDLQHLMRYVFDTALPTLLANEAGAKLLTPAPDDYEDEDADSFRVSFSLSPRARRFDSSLHPVLIAEALPRGGGSIASHEKLRAALAEQLFETHQVPAISFQLSGLMATYDPFAWERVGGLADDPLLAEFLAFQASPRRDPQVEMLATQWLHAEEASGFTGVVLDMGHACTQVLPVVGGRALLDAAEKVALAGHHVTETLANLLRQQGACLQSPSELETARAMKEQRCYVPLVHDSELVRHATQGLALNSKHEDPRVVERSRQANTPFHLSDGSSITLGPAAFTAAECLFRPRDLGVVNASRSVAEAVRASLTRCPRDWWPALLDNVVLVGGCAQLPGVSARLERELSALLPASASASASASGARLAVRVLQPRRPALSVWRGAALFAQHTLECDACTNSGGWLRREVYEEYGACVLVAT